MQWQAIYFVGESEQEALLSLNEQKPPNLPSFPKPHQVPAVVKEIGRVIFPPFKIHEETFYNFNIKFPLNIVYMLLWQYLDYLHWLNVNFGNTFHLAYLGAVTLVRYSHIVMWCYVSVHTCMLRSESLDLYYHILGQAIIVKGCPVHCKMLGSIPGLHSVYAGNILTPTSWILKNENVSRSC